MFNTTNKKPHYLYNDWTIIEEKFAPENNYKNETIFALGNGFLGMRGTFEEGYSDLDWRGLEGTYINGFYETQTIQYGESAYAFPEQSQTMLNVPNGKIVRLFLEDEEFNMLAGEIVEYKRQLNLREGMLQRSLEWRSPKGKMVRIKMIRLVSLCNPNLAAINYEITPLNFSGEIKLISALDGDVTNLAADKDPRIGSGLKGRVLELESLVCTGTAGVLTQRTQQTRFTLVCAMENQLLTVNQYNIENHTGELRAEVIFTISARQNIKITLNKFLSYFISKDCTDAVSGLLPSLARKSITEAKSQGFPAIFEAQKDFLKGFWDRTDVEIKGDPAIQQGIRFNIFQLLQSVGRDGKSNIAAKGLTGEGYEGHYFWDTETYILPFFLFNNPEISRKLLEYRYHTLDKARIRARQMAHPKGALFPWRTIGGEECSAYFPAGTAQYHINADIALAIHRYMDATDDWDFLIRYGAEILFETARLWADLGDFIPQKGNKFCINGVTGPDEYTAIVNNNCYTNLMAKENLEYAYKVACWMREYAGENYQNLAIAINLEKQEVEFWKKAADNMYIAYDSEMKIHLQDDDFLNRAPWDFENTPPEKYPLLMHYHPLVIYRHQVCKQADLVLALFLLGNQFSTDQKKRDFDFYEKFTTHDSSLSTCIFSIMASEIGYLEKAYQYFLSTARMDLDNTHGNTQDGIHAANMAGTWLCLANGFAGMRAYDGILSFNPVIPQNWEEYRFKVTYKGRLIQVTVNRNGAIFELLKGNDIEVICNGQTIVLKDAATLF